MEQWVSMIITVVCSVIASGGFWSYMQKRADSKDAKTDMLKGLGHDRIMELANRYIQRGYITPDEYENLNDYLFVPYEGLHGNGTAKRIMDEVRKLPIRPNET